MGIRWQIAVTAAPRDGVCYLPATIDSIEAAGWPDGVVYAEPGTLPYRWPMRFSGCNIGPWPQFQRAVRSCLSKPCDALIVFQDDCLVAANCREWMESRMSDPPWPDDAGVVYLYTVEAAVRTYKPGPGWFLLPNDGKVSLSHGAVAIMMFMETARWLADEFPSPSDRCKTDLHLEKWCRERDLRIAAHNPSLVRHVGVVSAVGRSEKGKPREAPGLSRWRKEAGWVEDCMGATILLPQEIRSDIPYDAT